jgi:hypothetical protein
MARVGVGVGEGCVQSVDMGQLENPEVSIGQRAGRVGIVSEERPLEA